jgi:hypothetical protein|tara:strand:- start:323 stop:496 length:174 start_codon:yes stop_codon:yes gene_type:complete
MAQNKVAVEKRRLELEAEKLDQDIKYIYMQKDVDSSYTQIGYKSGRTVTHTTTYNAN